MVIRAGTPDDDAALQEIDAATWSSAVNPTPPPVNTQSFFGSTSADEVLVAEYEGEAVGYAALGPVHKIQASSHVVELKSLAVHPDQQRRGIGRLLVRSAVEAARRRQARRLVLRVLGSNRPARRLYKECGFTVEGVLREQFLLDGRYVDDVLLALELTRRG